MVWCYTWEQIQHHPCDSAVLRLLGCCSPHEEEWMYWAWQQLCTLYPKLLLQHSLPVRQDCRKQSLLHTGGGKGAGEEMVLPQGRGGRLGWDGMGWGCDGGAACADAGSPCPTATSFSVFSCSFFRALNTPVLPKARGCPWKPNPVWGSSNPLSPSNKATEAAGRDWGAMLHKYDGVNTASG